MDDPGPVSGIFIFLCDTQGQGTGRIKWRSRVSFPGATIILVTPGVACCSSPWQGPGADCLVVQGAGVYVGGGLGLVHPCEADPGPQVVRPGPGQRLLGVQVDILVMRLGLLPCLLYKTLVNIYSEDREREWSLISGMAGLGR